MSAAPATPSSYIYIYIYFTAGMLCSSSGARKPENPGATSASGPRAKPLEFTSLVAAHTSTRAAKRHPRAKGYQFFFLTICQFFLSFVILGCTRREFLREILYENIAIIAIQHRKIYFVDIFSNFSHTVE